MAEEAQSAQAAQPPERRPKSRHTPPGDVAKEQYKGPGIAAAAAGGAFIAHWVAAFFGGIVGGTISAIFSDKVNGYEQKLIGYAGEESKGLSRLLRNSAGWAAKASRKAAGFLEPALSYLKISENRTSAFIFGGGVTALAGFILGTIFFGGKSAGDAVKGRSQFERAKDEIWTLRAEYDDLRQKFLDTKSENEDLRAETGKGKPTMDDEDDVPPAKETRAEAEAKVKGETPKATVSNVARDATVASAPQVAVN